LEAFIQNSTVKSLVPKLPTSVPNEISSSTPSNANARRRARLNKPSHQPQFHQRFPRDLAHDRPPTTNALVSESWVDQAVGQIEQKLATLLKRESRQSPTNECRLSLSSLLQGIERHSVSVESMGKMLSCIPSVTEKLADSCKGNLNSSGSAVVPTFSNMLDLRIPSRCPCIKAGDGTMLLMK
jgi:hypothetical protein